MSRVLFVVSLIFCSVSFVVHIGSILQFEVLATNWLFVLHVGVFVVFAPFVLYLVKGRAIDNPLAGFTRVVPTKYAIMCSLLFFYILVNFVIFMAKSKGGVTDIWGDEYVLHNHGKLIKYLTLEEYKTLKLNESRGFSGHWLFFYFTPMLFYYFKMKRSGN